MTYLVELVTAIAETLYGSLANLVVSGFEVDSVLLAGVLSGVFIWILAAATASSLAETRGKGPRRHFLAGLVIPVIYGLTWTTIYLLQARSPDTGGSQEESGSETAQPASAQGEQVDDEATVSQDASSESESQAAECQLAYDKNFFSQIQQETAEEGQRLQITLDNKTEILVEEIAEVLDTTVSVRIRNQQGNLKTMRIPYHRIENVQREE